jgi:IS30 family transposase
MRRTYHHLSPEDRAMIMIERQNGSSLRSIARRLGRSPSTLSRELRRAGPGMYDATRAAEGYRERRGASRRSLLLTPGTALCAADRNPRAPRHL